MALKIKKSGVLVDTGTVKRRSGGAWVTAATVKRRSGGAWVTVWTNYVAPTVAMPNVTDYKQGSVGSVQTGIVISSDGTWAAVGGQGGGASSGTWLTAGVATDVEIYATTSGGTGASWSGTTGSWVTGGLTITMTRSTNGSSYGTISLTFRNKTTQAQLDTATITLESYRGIPV